MTPGVWDPFPLTLDDGAALERLRDLAPRAAVCTMPEPWALFEDDAPEPMHVVPVGSVERDHLGGLASAVPPGAQIVIGVGGGSSIDTAKYVAEATGLPLLQIPTIISVDAAFTAPYGYREGSRVRYAGNLRPIEVVCDPTVIRRSPPELNRAGVGDLLSCHTGMFDWKVATDAGLGDIPWNEEAAALGRRVLAEMSEMAPQIAEVTPDAVRWLATTHRDVGAGCVAYEPRFEEGSEHFLAYCFEWLTNGHWVHGELISFCVLVMSTAQGNDPELPAAIVRDSRVDARPSHLGIPEELFHKAFAELPAYCEREDLWPSAVGVTDVTPELGARALAFAKDVTGA